MFIIKSDPGQKLQAGSEAGRAGPVCSFLSCLWLEEEDGSRLGSPGVAGLVSGACWLARITTSGIRPW